MGASEQILERVSELAPQGQVVLAENCEIVLWNAWMVTASIRPKHEAIGRCIDAVFPELSERVLSTISRSLELGASSVLSRAFLPHPFPLQNRQFRDRAMFQSVTISGFRDLAGLRYCLINIVDVSHEVQREEALRRNHRELEMFTMMVGHDLRAPLRGVLRFAEMLSDDLVTI